MNVAASVTIQGDDVPLNLHQYRTVIDWTVLVIQNFGSSVEHAYGILVESLSLAIGIIDRVQRTHLIKIIHDLHIMEDLNI